jgi:hypothetical protein
MPKVIGCSGSFPVPVSAYSDAGSFRADLERRLEERAGRDKFALALNRERVVVDRLLPRLLAVAPGQWSVTGPFALDLKFLHCTRVISKLEIEWRVDRREKFPLAPYEMADHYLGDFFEFELSRSGMGMTGKELFTGFDAHALLAGDLFETVRIDFHLRYGEISTEPLQTYDLLEFAGMEPVEVPGVLLELRVAEMLCEYVKRGGKLGISQMTDLIDLGEIASRTHFQAFTLREAIREAFELHKLHPVPESLPRPVAEEDEVETFRGIAERVGAPTDHEGIFEEVAALFDPILSGEVKMGVWDAYRRCWVSGRPENGHDLSSA